jgi:hypothetical protein
VELTPVCEVFEEVLNAYDAIREYRQDLATEKDRVLDRCCSCIMDTQIVYYGLRSISAMTHEVQDDGALPDVTMRAIDFVMDVLEKHPDVGYLNAWCCCALMCIAESHGGRIAIMGFDWPGLIKDRMLNLIEATYYTDIITDGETRVETEIKVVPASAVELAQFGTRLFSVMAFEAEHRDYIASMGVPAVCYVMGECDSDVTLQVYAAEALHNFCFMGEAAAAQANECDAIMLLEKGADLDGCDEILQRRCKAAITMLTGDGWRGTALTDELMENEANHHAKKKKKKAIEDAGKPVERIGW